MGSYSSFPFYCFHGTTSCGNIECSSYWYFSSDLHIYHLFYADDALFMGEGDEINVYNHIQILCCFYMVLGLKTNLSKSNFLGVGMVHCEVISLTFITDFL